MCEYICVCVKIDEGAEAWSRRCRWEKQILSVVFGVECEFGWRENRM